MDMEKRSTHWADVLKWLEKVVDSCSTQHQAESCERLIKNFHRVYQKQLGLREVWDLTRDMEMKLISLNPIPFSEKVKKLANL